ncbi:MAG TPA: ABC transporter ATP-binding protein [Kineosporiaceae bacterium]|nr:ABC transporter ATP-binding protein [Kineosporiaceae bacterium]
MARITAHSGANDLVMETLLAHRRDLGRLLGVGALWSLLELAPALVIRRLVDSAVVSGSSAAVLTWVGVLTSTTLVGALLQYRTSSLRAQVGEGMAHELRERLYRGFLDLPFLRFTATPSGELISRVMNDPAVAQLSIVSALPMVIVHLLGLVVLCCGLLVLDWRLGVAALAVLPVVAPLAVRGAHGVRRASRESLEAGSELVGRMVQTLDVSGATQVRLSAAAAGERERFRVVSRRYADRTAERLRLSARTVLTTSGAVAAATGAVLGLGGLLVARRQLTLGTLFAFATVLAQTYSRASALASTRAEAGASIGALIRVSEALQWPRRPASLTSGSWWATVVGRASRLDRPSSAPGSSAPPELRFESVTFAYGDVGSVTAADQRNTRGAVAPRGGPVLEDLDLVIPAGATVAVVGPSGSGKTSLAYLAAGLVHPDRGQVLLGGRDVRSLDDAERARSLAFVTQDMFLFHDTLAANIAYGCPGVDPEAIERAAEEAGLAPLLAQLPDGYDTMVGERGFQLSAGERQRVAIARALVRRPELLIMDEPTSHLDASTESRLRSTLLSARAGRTCLIVTHRLRLAEDADQVIVLDGGRVVEAGPPGELAEQGGPFAALRSLELAFSRSPG